MNDDFILRPNMKQAFKCILKRVALPLAFILIVFFALSKVGEFRGGNLLIKAFQSHLFSGLPLLVGIFGGGFFAWFAWHYFRFWKVDSNGIMIRQFMFANKLLEWKSIEAVSGDSDSVSILSHNWKIQSKIPFIDFDSYKRLLNYLSYYKYNTLDLKQTRSGQQWLPIG